MRTVIDKKNNYAAEVFESLTEFSNTLKKANENRSFDGKILHSKDGSFEFTGTENFDEAQTYLQKGYKHGQNELEKVKGTVKVSAVVEKKKSLLNVAGFAPCVPAAIQGKPKTMYYTKKERTAAPVVRLYYDRRIPGCVSQETITRGGANVVELVKYLEAHGMRVELYACHVTRSSWQRFSKKRACIVRIKAAAAALNLQLISYPIIHASYVRRHIFRWMETSKITVGYSNDSYGYTDVSPIEVLRTLGLMEKDAYLIDCETAAGANSIEDLLLRVGLKM